MNPNATALEGTRERILAYLEENRTVTVVTLSRLWGLTRADIRYHLNHLIEDGLVERTEAPGSTHGAPKSAQRGRPTVTYRLSARSMQDNYANLSCALLHTLLDPLPGEAREEALKALAEQLVAGTAPQNQRLTSARFNQAVEALNRQSYRARWEASPTGPRFLLRACPYAAIIHLHPELCRMDQHLLELLTGLPLRQSARVASASGSPPACVFVPQ